MMALTILNPVPVPTPESIQRDLELYYPYRKIGPSDPALQKRFPHERDQTTLGELANWSDLIAIGRVATQDWASVVINVETALVGCTNGQPVTIKLWPYDNMEPFRGLYEPKWLEMKDRLPTNGAFIVFSAYTNEVHNGHISPRYWRDLSELEAYKIKGYPVKVRKDYRWWYDNRSWWYTDRDNGVLLEKFMNIIHTTRIERNWTNYVHFCRDGNFKDSIRVREDSFYDLREFARHADAEQAEYFYNDSLIMPELKEYLFERYPHLKPKE